MMIMFFPRLLPHSLFFVACFVTFAFGAARLPNDEVQTLKEIAKTLGKTDWDFSGDANPCSGQLPWTDPSPLKGFDKSIICNCSFENRTVCHITGIILKSQDLQGTLPLELVNLTYLQEIDLTRNYLSGTIPPVWSSLPLLLNISLVGNHLTGSIPKELGDITTLKSLDISFNNFSGPLPLELGSLANIERMLLSSNNFNGELPKTFAKLTKIKDFRISDSQFSGQIPDFIGNWKNLEKLLIQASGLTGPIPSGIFLLTSLTDLRITDLSGPESPIPSLDKMKKMKTLMLRSCNLTGQLPTDLAHMNLKTLDLSFNKLTGEIPNSFASLADTNYIFLTGNLLTGPVPAWPKKNVDLSYNNLTISDASCPRGSSSNINLFASSSKGNSSRIVTCFKTSECPKYLYYSLLINCGGSQFTVPGKNGAQYDDDRFSAGPSFYESKTNWALSSTGYFTDDDRTTDAFIWTNETRLSMANPQLYMNARLSPISLTYFGFCLGNGNYTVSLHFAEIMFRNGSTYRSVGRRIFDIYIQGKLLKKDFNIMDEARVFGDVVIKNFTTLVTNNTLEIRLYWAGKGTTGIPVRGVYGPLISAISVEPNFVPPPKPSTSTGGGGVPVGAVVGIVVGGVFIVLLIFGILWKRGLLGQQKTLEDDLKGVDLQTGKFTFKQLKDATSNFDKANKIGEGGFGSVYKGVLADGTVIAVKQLSSKSKQGNREFVNEIGMISALQHPHLVKLHGCCIEGNQLLLVYEYLENNSVAHALFREKEGHLKLDWSTRHKICIGTARGLAYLHEESRLKVVHRDIKATNVLLDKNLNPKISDFGLAKLDEEDNTHISTRIAGTYGYMAPEYAMRGYLTDKADVYSFGILVLEIVSGRNNTTYRKKEESFYLLDWARLLKEQGNLMDLVDPRLGLDFNKEEMIVAINVALLCCNVTSTARPTMSSVVSMLEGKAVVHESVSDPKAESIEIDAMRKHFQSSFGRGTSEKQIETGSTEGLWTASSAHDLYPVNPDSDYWESRSKRT
ncbi:probable leucine-rich repeat receptor-like serine/threonine-protein kinase At3g14840 [Pyrus x bretschneideri]|uniref:probable leucine-rich repeat receptor-like serine/threonine-protein kinase At3g14840 n=1 Tax=Pyrus x bretschneideri TaxID=225117 RepID=UPI00202DD439|nr:probable leucine-rich repeat receptor-like serine/threonine-protein kinase At3g14840 [Pyrus x bretschneideri]